MIAFSPGITIRNDSDRPFRVSARPYRNASIASVIKPVDIAPGESIHFFDNPHIGLMVNRGSPPSRPALPKMSIDELTSECAFAYADPIYGQDWRIQLQARARVAKKTVDRWLDGTTPVPGPVAAMVRADAMCRRHGIDLV